MIRLTIPSSLLLVAVVGAFSSHAGLVAQYTFDDADIPEFSSVGSAVTTGQTGQFAEAYSFGGDEGNDTSTPTSFAFIPINTTVPVPLGSDERTIAIWFNQTGISAEKNNKIWGYGSNGTAGQTLDMSLEGGGIRLRHFGGNITYGSGFDFDGVDAGWNHLAVRVNASASTFADVDVFLNGTLLTVSASAGGGTATAINTTASVFGVGTSSNTTGFANTQGFIGLLDELRIYDNALTDQEIAQLAATPPEITSITKVGTTVTVQFNGTDGQTYDLNKSTDLDFSVLDSKDSVTLSGTTTGTLEDTTASESAAFYRVEEQ